MALSGGGVVAYPTEAVWGLGVDPFIPHAVERLLVLKRRRVGMGLILIADCIGRFAPFLDQLSAEERARLEDSWPGPVTWLLAANDAVPPWIRGDHHEVALRVTRHPQAAALCAEYGGVLVSTSANPHGAQPARHLFQVRRYFGKSLDAVVPGNIGGLGRPTKICRLSDLSVVRAG